MNSESVVELGFTPSSRVTSSTGAGEPESDIVMVDESKMQVLIAERPIAVAPPRAPARGTRSLDLAPQPPRSLRIATARKPENHGYDRVKRQGACPCEWAGTETGAPGNTTRISHHRTDRTGHHRVWFSTFSTFCAASNTARSIRVYDTHPCFLLNICGMAGVEEHSGRVGDELVSAIWVSSFIFEENIG